MGTTDLPTLHGAEWLVLGAPQLATVQALFERCAAFVEWLEGRPLRGDEAEHLLADLPPGCAPADKLALGVVRAGQLAGVVELVRDFPEPGTWYLGLLLLAPDERGHGLGERIHAALARWVEAQGGRRLRLVVQQQNPAALRFWLRLGYTPVGTAVQQLELREHSVTRLELVLGSAGALG